MKWPLYLAVVAGLATYSARSEACCGDGVVAATGATEAGSAVSSSIATATSTLTASLRSIDATIAEGFGKVLVELEKQTAAQKTIQQGAVASETQLYMEKARADAATTFEVSGRACFETSGGAAIGTAAAETAQNADDLNRRSATRTLYTPNTAAVVKQMVDTHASKYCSDQDASLGRCAAVSKDLQNADVRMDSLLTRSSLTVDQIQAAQSLGDNLTNPIPTQNLPQALEGTSAGKMFVAGQLMEQTGMSVASNSVNQAIAVRTPVQGLGTSAMMNVADISEMGLMEAQVTGRFESPEWYTMLAGMTEPNLLREMNKQQALQVWMDLKSYKQAERTEMALASLLALQVRRDSTANLASARESALRSK